MTDSKLVERLKKRSDECRRLSDIAEGTPLATYRAANADFYDECIAALETAEEALHGLITVLVEPANLTPEIALDKGALPRFLDECERATQEAVARARSAYALIKGGSQ